MKFSELTITNFMSFGDKKQTLHLGDQGLVLIQGENKDDPSARDNGSGKSSLVEALLWCLYGRTLRGDEADAVINRFTERNCVVTVRFTDDHGDEWLVIRARKHDEWKTGLRLFRNTTVDETLGTSTDTQAKLERVLGLGFTTFVSTVVFGQTAAYRFSLLTDKQQKEILDDALGIEVYARAGDLSRTRERDLQGEATLLQRRLQDNETQIANLDKEIEEYQQNASTFDRDHKRRLKAARERLDEAEAELAEASKKTDELAKHEKTHEALLAKVQRLAKDGPDIERRLKKCTGSEAAHRAEHTRYTKLAKLGVGVCSQCGQGVSHSHVEAMQRELKAVAHKLEAATTALQAVEQELKEQRAAVNTAEAAAQAYWRKHIAPLMTLRRSVSDLARRAASARAEVKEVKAEVSPYEALLAKATTKRAAAVQDLAYVRKAHDKLQHEIELHEFWTEAFSTKGLRSLLLDNALPVLNQHAQEYASILSDGNLSVEFNTQSQTKSGKTVDRFEVVVTNTNGGATYQSNSGGEKTKVDLIVGLALQSLVASRAHARVNVAFFDEPFESLDDVAIDRVVTLLSSPLVQRETMFVITHQESLKVYFPSTLTVTKKKRRSVIQ